MRRAQEKYPLPVHVYEMGLLVSYKPCRQTTKISRQSQNKGLHRTGINARVRVRQDPSAVRVPGVRSNNGPNTAVGVKRGLSVLHPVLYTAG